MSPLITKYASIYTAAAFASLILSISASSDGTCYFPAGNIADNNVPCNPDASVSSCCSEQSFCLANGLCLVNDDPNTVEFARGACTDPTFEDPACFQHCHGSQPGSPATNGAAVFECGTTGFANPANYCCENGIDRKTACCSTSTVLFSLGPGTYGSMTSSPTATLSSPSGSISVTTDTVTVTDTEVIPCSTATTLPRGSVSVEFSTSLAFVSSATAVPSANGTGTGAVTASSGVTAVPAQSSGANATAPVSTAGAVGGRGQVGIGVGLGGFLAAVLGAIL